MNQSQVTSLATRCRLLTCNLILPLYLSQSISSPSDNSLVVCLYYFAFHRINHISVNMKSSLLAGAALLGTASAGVHKAKLQKVPLAEQLVRFLDDAYRY